MGVLGVLLLCFFEPGCGRFQDARLVDGSGVGFGRFGLYATLAPELSLRP